MGCDTYFYNDYQLYFDEMNDEVSCLCTFPHNNQVMGSKIWYDQLRSMAYLGATIALCHDKFFKDKEWICVPGDLPEWIRKEIDEKITMIEE
jgi:hypothetical protein